MKRELISAILKYAPDTIVRESSRDWFTIELPNSLLHLTVFCSDDSFYYYRVATFTHSGNYSMADADKFAKMWTKTRIFTSNWGPLFRKRFSPTTQTHFNRVIRMVDENTENSPIKLLKSRDSDMLYYTINDLQFSVDIAGYSHGYIYLDEFKIGMSLMYIPKDEILEALCPISVVRQWKLSQLM
jgi:hypothetical protein